MLSLSWLQLLALVGIGVFSWLLAALGVTAPLSDSLVVATADLRSNFRALALQVEQDWTIVLQISDISQRQSQLSAENTRLRADLAKAERVFAENKQLLAQLGITYDRDFTPLGARVVASGSARPGYITINRGRLDGIAVGNAALSLDVAIGEVVEVADYYAVVRLFSAGIGNLPVRTATVSIGLLRASASGDYVVAEILQTQPLAVGERIYSSGLNGTFPPGLFIGEVRELEVDPRAPTKSALLNYPVDPQRLDEVVVLTLPSVAN